MKKFIPLFFSLAVSVIFAQSLSFSEIMFYPSESNGEFIELYNCSSVEANLKGIRVKYQSSVPDEILSISGSFILPPGGFAVILEGAYDVSGGNYMGIIPKSALLLKTADAGFGSSGMSNSSDRTLLLLDLKDSVLSSYTYSANNGQGTSDEKININGENEPGNWGNSIKATPGRKNSISPKDFDLCLRFLKPGITGETDSLRLIFSILNLGGKASGKSLLKISLNEYVYQKSLDAILPKDSLAVTFELPPRAAGTYALKGNLEYSQDEDSLNNSINQDIRISGQEPSFNDIVINEIMPAPIGDEPEWVELYNKTEKKISLNGFSLGDSQTKSIIQGPAHIEPYSYSVISDRAELFRYYFFLKEVLSLNLPSLNNSGDILCLRGASGITIDSLKYDEDMVIQGVSLERVRPEGTSSDRKNWVGCPSSYRASPGKINFASPKFNDTGIACILPSPEFPVSGDMVSLSASVLNYGSLNQKDLHLDFFSDSTNFLGRLDIPLIRAKDSIRVSLTAGIKIDSSLHITAVLYAQKDEDSLNNHLKKTIKAGLPRGTIIISEFMPYPDGGCPVWIEVQNLSASALSLNLYQIETEKAKYRITYEHRIPGKGFLIIARDSNEIKNFYKSSMPVTEIKDLSISRYSGEVSICDQRGMKSDSISYRGSWKAVKGKSFERIKETGSDSSCWAISLAPAGASPGLDNFDLSLKPVKSMIINEIMYEPAEGNSEFIEIQNRSQDSANSGLLMLYDARNNFYRMQGSNEIPPGSYFLLSEDSSFLTYYSSLKTFSNFSVIENGFTLPNEGGQLVLKDIFGNLIDEVDYSKSMHNRDLSFHKNVSLERISAESAGLDISNWTSSVATEGATPGKRNSVNVNFNRQESNLSASPNPFSPDGDGHEDFCLLNYRLKAPFARVRLRVFDSKGRLVRTVSDGKTIPGQGEIIYDGRDDAGRYLRVGIYILLLEAVDGFSNSVESIKTALVVARKF